MVPKILQLSFFLNSKGWRETQVYPISEIQKRKYKDSEKTKLSPNQDRATLNSNLRETIDFFTKTKKKKKITPWHLFQ